MQKNGTRFLNKQRTVVQFLDIERISVPRKWYIICHTSRKYANAIHLWFAKISKYLEAASFRSPGATYAEEATRDGIVSVIQPRVDTWSAAVLDVQPHKLPCAPSWSISFTTRVCRSLCAAGRNGVEFPRARKLFSSRDHNGPLIKRIIETIAVRAY